MLILMNKGKGVYCTIFFNFSGDLNFSKGKVGTSLVVQWLRLSACNAGDPGSIPGRGTGSHVLQLKD